MNTNTTEINKSPIDLVLLLAALAILIAGVYGYYYYDAESGLLRGLGMLVVVAVATGLVYLTEKGKALWTYFGAAKTEVRKVVWPTRAETVQTTIIVLIMVVLVGIALWLVDMFLGWGFTFSTGQGG